MVGKSLERQSTYQSLKVDVPPGRLPVAAQERRKAGFRLLGRLRAEFRRRRIPVENPAYSAYWNRAMGEPLHIPTFAAGASGPFLPATAIKGALRTGMLFANWRDGMLQDVLGRVKGERAPRRPAESVEEQALGPAGSTRMRLVSAGDSVKIYLLRTSTLMPRGANFALGWKRSPSGSVDGARPDDSTPAFAEMANPGTTFHGVWDEKAFFFQPDVRRSVRWPESFNRAKIFESVNVYAAGLLALQRNYRHGRHGPAGQEPGRVGAATGRGPRPRQLPLVHGLGRRPLDQSLLARHHQRRLPPDPGTIPDLQPRPGDESPLP